jgi:hypothetical protein
VFDLKEFGDTLLVARPPTTSGQWQGSGVTYATFALEKSLKPTDLFAGIIDSTLEFNPTGLNRAVDKARKEAERLGSGTASDDNGDEDLSSGEAEGTPKKKRLPSLQPAFNDIIAGIQGGLDHQDYNALRDPCNRLVKLCQIIKISKQGGADTDKLDPGLEQYVRDAHKAAREAAKQKLLVPGSDNSTGSEHVEAGLDIDEID